MGDRLREGELPQYFTEPPRPTQPPTISVAGNESTSQNAVMLYGWVVKTGMAHSMWINVWVAGKTM